ncbi:alpha/beta hydrolase [Pseudoalteromonas sp. JBTF-M23]|uniref:Alpha/beta hydrolase n=1 Tax=Pseudoalteromonas caenipelagi TaxID=2726988 RepID=A0A849VCQ0_9GAMM|nr:alpha/beta hydrolase-fold protein [Pseudoalteromonas caenipelagi]NOU51449.1 alpha/beta hydrolase [Pseudoalteromonas caenipelagi]
MNRRIYLLLLSLLSLFCSCVQANNKRIDNSAFKIPRSHIVELQDTQTQHVYPLFIKLPRSYQANPDKRYPVIYITDAGYSFQIVSGATRFPMNTGKMAEAIIVGISYSKGSKGSASRVRDYTPFKASNWKMETGQAKQHLRFIEAQVITYIDKHFRTILSQRTFVGNSLGGLFGAYILATKPALFSSYVLGSPSFWYHDKAIFKQIELLDKKQIVAQTKLFVGVGALETKVYMAHEMVGDAKSFANMLEAKLIPTLQTKLMVIPEANHETAFPTTAIQGLYWIYKNNT